MVHLQVDSQVIIELDAGDLKMWCDESIGEGRFGAKQFVLRVVDHHLQTVELELLVPCW
jgi:hypothetical protein